MIWTTVARGDPMMAVALACISLLVCLVALSAASVPHLRMRMQSAVKVHAMLVQSNACCSRFMLTSLEPLSMGREGLFRCCSVAEVVGQYGEPECRLLFDEALCVGLCHVGPPSCGFPGWERHYRP